MEKQTYSYYGYTVTLNGEIFNPHGRKLSISKRGTVMVKINGTKQVFKASRVIYEAVSGIRLTDPMKLTHGIKEYVIAYKDGDKANIAYDNLLLQTREEYFCGKEWGTEKYSKEIRDAIINDYNKKGDEHVSYKQLTEKYGCCSSTIRTYLKKSKEEEKKTYAKV